MKKDEFSKIELLIGNSSRKFSGGTSIMLQLLDYQEKLKPLVVIGKHYVPEHIRSISFFNFLKIASTETTNGKPRIFYARRNDEMIQALIAKWFFGAKLKIIFSSSEQRSHTKFTKWLIQKMDALVSTSSRAASYLTSRKAQDKMHPMLRYHMFHLDQGHHKENGSLSLPYRELIENFEQTKNPLTELKPLHEL